MLLLDTHTLLWFYGGDPQIPTTLRDKILDIQTVCIVSIASLWEIAIKLNPGKLALDTPLSDLFDFIVRNQMQVLPIEFTHLLGLSKLPHFHKDPFDRIIIAQALAEGLSIATKDAYFQDYEVKIEW